MSRYTKHGKAPCTQCGGAGYMQVLQGIPARVIDEPSCRRCGGTGDEPECSGKLSKR